MDNNTQAFLALVRAGLWENEVKLLPYGNVDFKEIYRLAEEQSVVGLVAAGLEHVADVKVAKGISLVFAGNVLQIEQRNKSMNYFIGELIDKMRNADIYTILVKGQGVAQCYERPMWRTSGDVDLLCSQDNFLKAQQFLLQLSSFSKPLERYSRHLGMSIDSWSVEIHGSLRTGLAAKVDSEIVVVQNDVFYNGNVRSWDNGKTQVFYHLQTSMFFLYLRIFLCISIERG